MRIFEDLKEQIERHATLLCLKHDDLELAEGRINGYLVAPAVYAAIYEYFLHQANLAKPARREGARDHDSEIWFNFGGVARDNSSVKRFDVTRYGDGKLRLKASLVTIANGLSPFEDLTDQAACCGNHCSTGCYDICPAYD